MSSIDAASLFTAIFSRPQPCCSPQALVVDFFFSGNLQLLVFGSFTEDEIRSLSQKKSAEKGESPVQKKEVQQVQSLKSTSGIAFGDFRCELNREEGSSKGKSVVQNGNSVEHKDVKALNETNKAPVAAHREENGKTVDATIEASISNGVKDLMKDSVGLSSSNASQLDNGATTKTNPWNSKFQVLDSEAAYRGDTKKENGQKPSNGSVAPSRNLIPHGLINSGNLCFLNATLQALLSCSPFTGLLQDLRMQDIPKVDFPTLTAFTELISNFEMPNNSDVKMHNAALETGRPFRPAMFEAVLKHFTPDVPSSISGRPRQEDAQEFLSFILDQIQVELLKLNGKTSGGSDIRSSLVSSSEDDEWETVGPKNKSAVTRTQSFLPSPLTDIFAGHLKNMVTAKGNRATANVEPFFVLHLDICHDAVYTIENALRLFSAPENLEGYRASTTGKAGIVAARKSATIQTLPKIMILHIKRFSYGIHGSTKLNKPVRFPLELMLGRELLASPMPSSMSRKYELVATITHHGREPSKGHYTADVRYPNRQWLRFDDACVTAIGINKVLHEHAYVLFYQRV
ncbi:Ubiquitin carboxyl-terminal hydrolase 24 [Linum perenne]